MSYSSKSRRGFRLQLDQSRRSTARRVGQGAELLEPRLVMYAVTGYQWSNPDVSASFLPDGTSTEGYVSNLFAELDAIAPRATWQREFARALQTWANASRLNFRFVSDNGAPSGSSGALQGDSNFGDIRLGAHPLTGYVGYTYYPGTHTIGGDITLSPDYTFQIGTSIDLYSVLVHEIGHAIGLGHSTSGTIMYPTIMGVYTGLTADDIAGVQAIYGARQHDAFDAAAANDSSATATGITLSGGSASLGADLTSMLDVDYFSVVAPTGDGTLSVSVDARNKSLLAPKLLIYNSAGALIGSATAGSAYGMVATVQLSGLVAGQTYTIVADGATADEFGMGAYNLNVQFGGVTEPTPPPPPPPSGPSADQYESNDTWSNAKYVGKLNAFSQSGLSIHTSTDVDFYSFQVSKSGTFRVSTQFSNASGNLDLVVYNNQQQVLATAATAADLESVTLNLSAGQTYYVKVFSPAATVNTYSFSIGKVSGGRGGGGFAEFAEGHGTPGPNGGEFAHDHEDSDHGLMRSAFAADSLVANPTKRAVERASGWIGEVGPGQRLLDRDGARRSVAIYWLDDIANDVAKTERVQQREGSRGVGRSTSSGKLSAKADSAVKSACDLIDALFKA